MVHGLVTRDAHIQNFEPWFDWDRNRVLDQSPHRSGVEVRLF